MEAIVLAAGYSTRANAFKMNMLLGQKTVLEHTVSKFENTCDKVIVVVGYQADEMIKTIQQIKEKGLYHLKIEYIFNKEYAKGMFSSVQKGCEAVQTSSFFITPGDCPVVQQETLQQLAKEKGEVIIPSFNHHLGHPIRLGSHVKEKILHASKQESLRSILNEYEKTYVIVDDPGVLMDLDTPDDYRNLVNYYQQRSEL